jgi:hypothetical protein
MPRSLRERPRVGHRGHGGNSRTAWACAEDGGRCSRPEKRLESLTDPRAAVSWLRWCPRCKRLVSLGRDPFA